MKRLTKRDKYGKPDTQKRLNVMFLDETSRNTMDEILDALHLTKIWNRHRNRSGKLTGYIPRNAKRLRN